MITDVQNDATVDGIIFRDQTPMCGFARDKRHAGGAHAVEQYRRATIATRSKHKQFAVC